ncbi:MAG: glycosyltransferase [Puniceicoccaceae bacterium]
MFNLNTAPEPIASASSAWSVPTTPSPKSTTQIGLRIAFFSDSLPERNGTGAYYHDLIAQLEPRVAEIKIFQPAHRSNNPFLSLPMPGDPLQRLVCPHLFRIAKAYRALKPHIVVGITPGPFGLLGLYHARRSGNHFITAFHTDFDQLAKIYWQPAFRGIASAYLRSINRILCERSAAVTINNSNLSKDVFDLGAQRVEIMGTPLPLPFLTQPLTPPQEEIKQVCFAGRLAKEKNIDRFIEAAREFPGIRFVIVGDGPLRQSLQQLARGIPNIRFLGWLKRHQIIEVLDASSLLVLPSEVETFGSVALEAMARGRPALVSSNAGIHDWPILADGLFALQRNEPVAAAIRRLISVPPDVLRKRATNARRAAESLNHDTISQWVEVLQRYAFPPAAHLV